MIYAGRRAVYCGGCGFHYMLHNLQIFNLQILLVSICEHLPPRHDPTVRLVCVGPLYAYYRHAWSFLVINEVIV